MRKEKTFSELESEYQATYESICQFCLEKLEPYRSKSKYREAGISPVTINRLQKRTLKIDTALETAERIDAYVTKRK